MISKKNAVVLAVIPFLVIMLIYSSEANFDAFARAVTGHSCWESNPTKAGAVSAQTCCWTTYDTATGKLISRVCQTCEYDKSGNRIDCRDDPSWERTTDQPSSIGTVQPPSTPPPPSNETHVNNLPGQIGTMQSLTSTCPNGSAPDANGNCPNPTASTTNQQGGLTSSNNDNNNFQQGHHHKGSNSPT